MINWHSIPFARLLIPFTIGIVVYNCSPGTLPFAYLLTALAGAYLLVTSKLKIQFKFKQKAWISLAISLLFVAVGIFRSHFSQANVSKTHYSKIEGIRSLKVEITDVSESKNDKIKITAEVKQVFDSSFLKINCSGLVLINLRIDSNSSLPSIGENFILKANLLKPEHSENPGTFNYQTYLERKQILCTVSTQSDKLIKTDEYAYHLKKSAYKYRDYCLKIIRNNIPNKMSYGISEALILGYKSDLNEETNLIFTRTGTLHILAVSGMHAGLIFSILNFLFGFLNKIKRGAVYKTMIILSCLWFYAVMSGLSASVVRAAVMFSLISIGKTINKDANPLNTIFSSAFLMLVFEPNYFFDTGFQLSYLAVLGIVVSYSKIRAAYRHKSKVMVSVLDLINVSLCAQILTFPISIFYFNQFPSYFILSNLIVIPVYTLIIFLILAIFPFSSIPLISFNIGKTIDRLIYYNDKFMKWTDQLPYSVIENINIEFIELFMLYLIILLILYFFYFKTKTSLILILLSLSILKPYQYYVKEKCKRQRFICLMGFKNADIYVCVDGEKAFVYGDSLSFTQKSIKNDLNRFFLKNNIKSKYMIREKDTFVSTNFRSIPALGFQFFDRIVTMENTAHLNGQALLYFTILGEGEKQSYNPKISANNLIISHKILKSKRESINKELFNVYGKKINISNRFRIICRF
jgi:competence protein ComEC